MSGVGLGEKRLFQVVVLVLAVIIVVMLILIYFAWRKKLKLIASIKKRKQLEKRRRELAAKEKDAVGVVVRGDVGGHSHVQVKKYDGGGMRTRGMETPSDTSYLTGKTQKGTRRFSDTATTASSSSSFSSSSTSTSSDSSTATDDLSTSDSQYSDDYRRDGRQRDAGRVPREQRDDYRDDREQALGQYPSAHMPPPKHMRSTGYSSRGHSTDGSSESGSPPGDFRRGETHAAKKRRVAMEDTVPITIQGGASRQVFDEAKEFDITLGFPGAVEDVYAPDTQKSRAMERKELMRNNEELKLQVSDFGRIDAE